MTLPTEVNFPEPIGLWPMVFPSESRKVMDMIAPRSVELDRENDLLLWPHCVSFTDVILTLSEPIWNSEPTLRVVVEEMVSACEPHLKTIVASMMMDFAPFEGRRSASTVKVHA